MKFAKRHKNKDQVLEVPYKNTEKDKRKKRPVRRNSHSNCKAQK